MVVVMMVVVVVVDAFVGLRSSCRPTPGLSVLMLETRSTLDPREQARRIEKERNTIGRPKRKRRSRAAMREIERGEIKRKRERETHRLLPVRICLRAAVSFDVLPPSSRCLWRIA